MKIHKITVGKWKENCYIIESPDKRCIIIDPGDDAEIISGFIEKNLLNPVAIVNTHAHYDHVGAVSDLKALYNVPFFLHSKDKRLLNHASIYRAFVGESVKFKIPEIDSFLDDEEKLALGEIKLKIYPTPGHTEGSVCIRIDNNLFTGDYLLNTRLGRTDLPGADKEKFKESIKFIIGFSSEIIIYPGHGNVISLQDEINNNPELQTLLNEI